jgi:excisionase family DNA binding protein
VRAEVASAFAATLEQLAAILREEAHQDASGANVAAPRMKLPAAAKATGISVSTLREWCARREVTSTKLGRDYMVRLSDIEAYLMRRTSKARPVPLIREVSA